MKNLSVVGHTFIWGSVFILVCIARNQNIGLPVSETLYAMRGGRKRDMSIAELYNHTKVGRGALEQQVVKDELANSIQVDTRC
jgi:hypothetical protein